VLLDSLANMTPEQSILVIDDDSALRYSLRRVLTAHGYKVSEAGSGEEALAIVGQLKPDVILLDNRMEGMSGIETLQHLHNAYPDGLIILMTAFGTTQTAIEAMKYGAFDYVMKPFDLPKILSLVGKAVQSIRDQAEARSDYKPLLNSADYEEGIVGNSEAMQAVIKTIGQVAASDATVLITGESGTGKELVARCLHQHSFRVRGPFIAVNCAAIPENLIESELFGFEKGAFTGATAQKLGKFELCDGGTIFLDEIGDMSLPTQTKILRAIQEGEIQRVGGTSAIKVNVRMVAATNKDLEQMVTQKTFREDLYYRLNVVRLRLPPLRERKEDIPLLVDFMLQRLSTRRKLRIRRLSAEALMLLVNHGWPGNVRELENTIYRASVITRGDTVLSTDLPPEIRIPAASQPAPIAPIPTALSPAHESPKAPEADFFNKIYQHLRHAFSGKLIAKLETEMVRCALEETEGNFLKSSKILGMNRSTVRLRFLDGNAATVPPPRPGRPPSKGRPSTHPKASDGDAQSSP
jgi:two-component system nitrogen regulation response regulator GlnG